MNKVNSVFKSFTSILGIIVILGSVVALGIWGYNKFLKDDKDNNDVVIIVESIENKISEIGELGTSQSEYTIQETYDKPAELFGKKWKILGKASATIKCSGVVKAGINLNKLKVKSTKEYVLIILPDAEILSNELKPDTFEILDEKKKIFTHIDLEDYSALNDIFLKQGADDAINDGILEDAKEKARNQLKTMFEDLCKKNGLELVIE